MRLGDPGRRLRESTGFDASRAVMPVCGRRSNPPTGAVVPRAVCPIMDVVERWNRTEPRVHLICGLNGAGKTTYAHLLERTLPGVRFSLDEWMLKLHGMRYDDPRYPDAADVCKELIWATARQVLRTGVDVILDWNQWSQQRRREWKEKAESAGVRPVLYYVRVPLEIAIARAVSRAAQRIDSSHELDAGAVRHLQSLFEVPTDEEGIEVRTIDG